MHKAILFFLIMFIIVMSGITYSLPWQLDMLIWCTTLLSMLCMVLAWDHANYCNNSDMSEATHTTSTTNPGAVRIHAQWHRMYHRVFDYECMICNPEDM